MPLGESMLSTIGRKSKKEKTEYNLPKSSPEVLSDIREKLRLQNNKTRTKQFIICTVLVIVIIISLIILA